MYHLNMQRIFFFPVVLLLGLVACGDRQSAVQSDTMNVIFDWQGHRGARGILPENTVPAFLKALEYPVTTLELDLAVSRDSQLVVSHEPWMSHHICRHPDGRPVTEAEEDSLLLFQLSYEEVRQFDCGSRGNARFPEQEAMATGKPTLREVVEAVRAYCEREGREPPAYNIEIKSRPEWDGERTPTPEVFAQLVLQEIERLGIAGHTCIQSFDVRALQAVHRLDPQITTALLIENPRGVQTNLEALGYTPAIYSPYYKLLAANVVDTIHDLGMRVIPWTVNDPAEMRTLIEMGVDGIITDYPNRIAAAKGR